MNRRGLRLGAAAAAVLLLLAGCSARAGDGSEGADRRTDPKTESTPTGDATEVPDGHGGTTKAVAAAPLREGERFVDLRMPRPYTPSAPTGVGTDDYRCFLLDPKLTEKAFLTG